MLLQTLKNLTMTSILKILEESLEHETYAVNLYKKLLAEVYGASVYLEEYARGQIGQEEQHALEIKNVKGLCVKLSYKDCGKIGFTCSTFDLLHAGHITMLEEAKHSL